MADSELGAALDRVYADSAGQAARYRQALMQFAGAVGPGPALVFRAPGRVNLIGEHTDYNHGFVLPMALDKDILLVARPRRDNEVRVFNGEPSAFPPLAFTMRAEIPPGPLGDWGNYVRAAAQAIARQTDKHVGMGMDVLVAGAPPWGVPRAAGLSSSSALVVVAATALAALNGVSMPKVDFARLCSEAEWYVGTRGGIMDHFISILAQRASALMLDCRPSVDPVTGGAKYNMEMVAIPPGYRFVICHSGIERQKTRSQYNVRVAECRLAVALLVAQLKEEHGRITHLRDVSAAGLGLPHDSVMRLVESLPERLEMTQVRSRPDLHQALQALTSPLPDEQVFMVRARARHIVSENARVLAGALALRAGNALAFGKLMNEAHASMSVDYDASCREVDILAAIAREAPGVAGARVTGAGWGGCIVVLVDESAGDIEHTIAARYAAATGLRSSVFVCRSGPGAGLVIETVVSATRGIA